MPPQRIADPKLRAPRWYDTVIRTPGWTLLMVVVLEMVLLLFLSQHRILRLSTERTTQHRTPLSVRSLDTTQSATPTRAIFPQSGVSEYEDTVRGLLSDALPLLPLDDDLLLRDREELQAIRAKAEELYASLLAVTTPPEYRSEQLHLVLSANAIRDGVVQLQDDPTADHDAAVQRYLAARNRINELVEETPWLTER